jgi:glycine/D-amino acid oxidase-like deaminating enzyme
MDLLSSHPFWPLKNGLLGAYPSLKQDVECEVVVLGAGITGALVADRLAQEGLDVAVVDKREAAGGSTSASTALLQYEIDTPLTELIERIGRRDAEQAYRVCLESIGQIETLCGELGDDCGFARKKSVYLATKKREIDGLRAECAARQAAGIEVAFLTEPEIAARFSFRRPAALLSSTAAEVDAFRLAHRLLARAQSRGARIFDRTPVEKYEPREDGITLTTDRGHRIRARWAVFATGYEAVELLDRRVVDLKSSFALVSEPLANFDGWWEQCLLWETARPYLYLRTTDDGRAIVGGEDDPFRSAVRRDALVPKKAARLAERFRELFPRIELEIAYAWAGTFGETKDGLAYIGSVPELPSCYFSLGFGGNGVTYSVIAAEIIRDAILRRPNPDAPLFRFDR